MHPSSHLNSRLFNHTTVQASSYPNLQTRNHLTVHRPTIQPFNQAAKPPCNQLNIQPSIHLTSQLFKLSTLRPFRHHPTSHSFIQVFTIIVSTHPSIPSSNSSTNQPYLIIQVTIIQPFNQSNIQLFNISTMESVSH